MVKINSLNGYFVNNKYADIVTALPYDVFSRNESYQIVSNNRFSFLRVEKPESDFELNYNPSVNELHNKAVSNFKEFVNNNLLIKSKCKNLYIYRQKMNKHVQTGIMADVSLDEYESGIIKKHELTKKNKEEDRTIHINTINANTGSVFLIHKYNKDINDLINNITSTKQPYIDFISKDDNVNNQLWIIDDIKLIEQIKYIYDKQINCFYIADGHHRAAAASNVRKIRKNNNKLHNGSEPYNYFLATIFQDSDLNIMDYNRIIADCNNLSEKEIINNIIKNNFSIEEVKLYNEDNIRPQSHNEISMFINNKWYKLKFNDTNNDDIIESLNVSILQNNILNPILNIKDPRTNTRIDYIGGIKGIDGLMNKCKIDGFKIAFLMYPVKVEQIIDIADSNKLIPPKSTWFEPKLRSGMVIKSL